MCRLDTPRCFGRTKVVFCPGGRFRHVSMFISPAPRVYIEEYAQYRRFAPLPKLHAAIASGLLADGGIVSPEPRATNCCCSPCSRIVAHVQSHFFLMVQPRDPRLRCSTPLSCRKRAGSFPRVLLEPADQTSARECSQQEEKKHTHSLEIHQLR